LSFKIHYSWLAVIALVTAVVTTQFSEDYPLLQRLALGLVVSVCFMLASVMREFILSLAVFRRGNPIRKMTLFPFGGVYREKHERAPANYLVLQFTARFLSNLVMAALFYGVYASFINAGNNVLAGVFQWLAYIFAVLFLLHILPAYPLDGGDILRMILWRNGGDYYRATHLASIAGWASGLLMVFTGGLLFIITRLWLASLLIIVLGWVILMAAGAIRRLSGYQIVLRHVRAEQLMQRDFPYLSPDIDISRLVRDYVLSRGWLYIIIVNEGRFAGLLTRRSIRSLALKRWNETTAGQIMTPAGRVFTCPADQTADVLLDEMYQSNVEYVPVEEDQRVVGVVTLTAIKNLIRVRAEFGL